MEERKLVPGGKEGIGSAVGKKIGPWWGRESVPGGGENWFLRNKFRTCKSTCNIARGSLIPTIPLAPASAGRGKAMNGHSFACRVAFGEVFEVVEILVPSRGAFVYAEMVARDETYGLAVDLHG